MANDFSNDPNCISLFRMESGGLNVDSRGTNTLTVINTPAENTTNYKEGSCACLFARADLDGLNRTDANLSSNFPLKSGTSNKTISVCFWVRMTTLPNTDTMHWLVTKYDTGTANKKSIGIFCQDVAGIKNFGMTLGYASGVSYESIDHGTTPSATTWYHITATYRDSDKAYTFRLKDTNGDTVGTDLDGIATLDANGLSLTTALFAIGYGYINGGETSFANATLDEIVIFDDIITADEATAIAKGLYTGIIIAPICWGHADATETTKRTFAQGWTVGTAIISGSGNSEKMTFYSGQNKESEVVQLSGTVRIRRDVYLSGSGNVTFKYKTGNSIANCEADSWHTYTAQFASSGYVKVRVEA